MGITNINMEKDRVELIKKIYELGFEVGFKNHSEIGWVLREYNTLVEQSNKLGIKSPEIYYHDGKLKGKKSRDSIDVKAPEKAFDHMKNVTVPEKKIEPREFEGFVVLRSQRKPGLNELPSLVKQSGHTEVPEFLDGFKGSSRFGHRKKGK